MSPQPTPSPLAIPPRARESSAKRRVARVAAASFLVLALPIVGATAAQATPIDGALTHGDSLFTGIGNGGYDVLHYDVAIDYAHQAVGDRPAGDVIATTGITATAPQALRSFSLDFEGMNVDSVTVNGTAATFTRPAVDKPREAYKLVVTPATPVEGEFTTVVKYSGVPSVHIDNDGASEGWVKTANGVIALGQPVGTMAWLPSNNTPADKATYDVKLTIPTAMNGRPAQGVSNGELVSNADNGNGTSTWRWTQQNQQATMSAMIGIGNYDMHQSTVTLTDGRQIPEWSFIDATLSEAQKTTTVQRLGRMQEITRFLESKYGAYPGNSTGIIVHKSNVGYALETQDRSYFPGVPSMSTLVHEIAHQWFGAAVSPNDWNNIWLSEGQATYASTMFNEEIGLNVTPEGVPIPSGSTAASNFANWNASSADHARWLIAPAAMTNQVQLFEWQSYTRGSMAYEALRQVVGEDVFFEILTTWIQSNSGHSKATTDFIAHAEATSGKNLSEFFQDWVYDADKPAWPSTWALDLAANPANGVVTRGSDIEYTLTVQNSGLVDLSGKASIDLADILDDATLDTTSLDPSLALEGTVLAWQVPATTGTNSASVSFTVTVNERAYGATLEAEAIGTLGAFCGSCTVSHTTAAVSPVTAADLTEDTRGTVTVPATAAPGDTITVQLGTSGIDGMTVSALLFSSPTDLGTAKVISGTAQFTIPAAAAIGEHRIAILDELGVLVGWDNLTLAKSTAGSDASATGTASGNGSDSVAVGNSTAASNGTSASNGSAGANPTASASGTKDLANTGTDGTSAWVLGGGALLLLAGASALLKRRRTPEDA